MRIRILTLLMACMFTPCLLLAQKNDEAYEVYRYKADWRVLYDFTRLDTVLNKMLDAEMVLQIGEEMQKFEDANQLFLDSVMLANPDEKDANKLMPIFLAHRPRCNDMWWRNIETGLFTQSGSIIPLYYRVENEEAVQDWNMSSTDTLSVCGHLCRKATCVFGGREWTAWYAEDLLMDAGPWKLHGLPGLILLAEDSEHLIRFEAKGIYSNGDYPIVILPRVDNPSLADYQRVLSRKTVMQWERMAALQPKEFDQVMGKIYYVSGGKIGYARKPYCPLEK